MYRFGKATDGINVNELMTDIKEQTDKLTVAKAILAKTKKDHFGARTTKTWKRKLIYYATSLMNII